MRGELGEGSAGHAALVIARWSRARTRGWVGGIGRGVYISVCGGVGALVR